MNINPTEFQQHRISDYLYEYANSVPEREAAWNKSQSISYAALLDKVEACAKALIASGIKKGDRVATLSPPHPDYFIVYLATTTIGAIWVGLNPRYTRDELEHVIADSEPRLIFAKTKVGNRQYEEDLRYFQSAVGSIEQIIVIGDDVAYPGAISYESFVSDHDAIDDETLQTRREDVNNKDAALLIYTSGTTGKPKGAILHHYGVIRHCYVQRSLRPSSEVRQINVYPINHLAGVIATTTYCLVMGGTSCFLEKFEPEVVLKTIEEKEITAWGGVPIMLQSVLDHPRFSTTDFSSVNEVTCSGGTASKDLLQRIADEVCPRITTMYALTEASGAATAIPCTDNVELLSSSVGKPLSDCEFRLVGENGQVVKAGDRGEIQVRGPFIMKGYWNLPDATRETIDEDGWLHTKDVAVERDDGNIVLVGRLSDMYKSGGYNIYPREIELVLESHPSVNLACVMGVADPVYNEAGYAFVTPTPGQSIDEATLIEHCRGQLANYKVPKFISVEEALPLLPNNKPDKRKLKELAHNNIQNNEPQSATLN